MGQNLPKDMYLVRQTEGSLKVDFEETLIDELIEDGWIEFVRTSENGEKEDHYLFPPQICEIKNINWTE